MVVSSGAGRHFRDAPNRGKLARCSYPYMDQPLAVGCPHGGQVPRWGQHPLIKGNCREIRATSFLEAMLLAAEGRGSRQDLWGTAQHPPKPKNKRGLLSLAVTHSVLTTVLRGGTTAILILQTENRKQQRLSNFPRVREVV